mgnify:CR=1 FL=1
MTGFLSARWIRLLALAVTLLFAAFIGMYSILPAEEGPGLFLFSIEVSDKVQHFIAYMALTGPLSVALGPRRTVQAIAIAAGYGLCLELAQMLGTDDREGSLLDALANLGGATLGAIIVRVLRGN